MSALKLCDCRINDYAGKVLTHDANCVEYWKEDLEMEMRELERRIDELQSELVEVKP